MKFEIITAALALLALCIAFVVFMAAMQTGSPAFDAGYYYTMSYFAFGIAATGFAGWAFAALREARTLAI